MFSSFIFTDIFKDYVQFDFTVPQVKLRTRGHRLSVTSAVASESGSYLFTSGKEGSIIKYDLRTGFKMATFHKQRPLSKQNKSKGKEKAKDSGEVKGHTDEVLALALSGDGRYLASGGRDRKVGVWDVEKAEWIRGFGGHKDLISVRLSYTLWSRIVLSPFRFRL
jgi:ribosomal RNA-processing protein 9